VEKMQFIFFVPPKEELEGTLQLSAKPEIVVPEFDSGISFSKFSLK
jgi:hypothetical protein